MWLIYIHQLDNLYKSYRFKIHPGSFGVTGVKRSFSPKLLFLLQITWYGHVTHAYWSDRYLYRSNRSKNSSGVIWGHRGQKVHFTKIAISPTDYMVWSCDSCIFISQIPSTKTFGLKFTRGHLGSQGSKGHFHQKCYFSFRVHGMVMRLMHIDQLDTLYKSYRIKIHLGSLGVTGVKSSFSQKTLFLQHITWYGHVTHAYLSDRYLYRSNRSKNSFGVIWGHRGSKGHFHLKSYNSSMLHSMTIRHIHVYTLETLYLCYGVKWQPGVIWGLRGQKVNFTKLL